MSYRSLFKNEQIYDPAIFRDSRSLHALVFRLSASRFARCPWIYLYKVRGRRAWGGLSAMPTAAQAASAPLMPFSPFVPEAYSGGEWGRFRHVYAGKRRRTIVLRFIDQLSQFAQPAKAARLPLVYGQSFGVRFRGAKPHVTTFRKAALRGKK